MRRSRRDRGSCAGFTLVELVTSLVVMGLLVVGLASGMMLVTSAVPVGQTPVTAAVDASAAIDRMLEDIEAAVHITDRRPAAITVVVPDRNGDGLPEVIQYSWSGTTGHALTRKYNDGSAVPIVDDVHVFSLAYESTTADEDYVTPTAQGSEVRLASHLTPVDSWDIILRANDWTGQFFTPSLPVDAISWSVTRALISAKKSGPPDAQTFVQLRTADVNGLPTDTVLEQRIMAEADLSNTYVWEEFTFSNVSGLSPADGLCLVLQHDLSPNRSASVEYDYEAGSAHLVTTDGGASWSKDSARALMHYIYGTITTAGTTVTLTREYNTAVRVTLQATTDATAQVESSVQTLNLPEVLTALWETDFSADPTLLDLDLDGSADWRVGGGGPFNAANLVPGGYWWADGNLNTNPGYDFNGPTTVDVRCRDDGLDGEAGGIILRVDRTGDTYAYIEAEVEKLDGSTQILYVSTYDPGLNFGPVFSDTFPAGAFIDLRIVVDPVGDTFNVNVNGVDRASYPYGRITANTSRTIRLYETNNISGVLFDRVRVRVGGTIQ